VSKASRRTLRGLILAGLTGLAGPLAAQRSLRTSSGGTPTCPAKAATASSLSAAGAMSASQATAFLAQVKKDAIALESPDGARALNANLATAAHTAHTTALGLGLFLGNYQNAAIAAFADAASASGAAGPPAMQASAWSNLGAALDAAGRHPQAVAAFEQAITAGVRSYPAVMGLGVARANAGDLDAAVPLLQEAARLAPTQSEPWLALANVLSCQGKGPAALAAARSAQTADWNADEQERIDHAERNADKSSDTSSPDDPDAPVPKPPAASPFAGYGRAQQGPQFATPIAPSDIFAYVSEAPQRLAAQLGYAAEANAHLARADKGGDRSDDAPPAAAQGAALVIVMRYRNDYTAKNAAGKVLERSTAKLNLALDEFSDAQQRLLAEATEKQQPIDATSERCERAATTNSNASTRCKEQRCRALNDMYQGMQQEWVQAYHTLYGGYATSAARYDKAMRAWIDYATSPGVQFSLDQERRGNLAKLQSDAYSQINTGFGPACSAAAAEQRTPPPEKDASDDKPGPCKKLKLDVPKAGSLDADCHELTFSPEIELPLKLSLTIHLTHARGNEPGSLYIGAGWAANGVVAGASASAGFKMTWDAGGLVTGSGGIAQVSASIDPELAAEFSEAEGRAISKSVTVQGGYDIVNHTAFSGAY
jgi:tetratricopeptide (TPR) repeat protein